MGLLAEALRQRRALGGRVARRKRVRPPVQPKAIEQDYLARLLAIMRRSRELVHARLLPVLGELARQAAPLTRTDGYADILADLVDQLEREIGGVVPGDQDLRQTAFEFAGRVNAQNSRETSRMVRELTGIDVIGRVPGLEEKASAFARQNVQLIKSLPADYLHDVEQTTLRALRTGKRAEEIAGELEDRFGVSANRAALIARDQIGKLNGEINQERQQNLGITRYKWRTANDERVRGAPGGKYPTAEPSHFDREGQIFAWNDPPEGGHPGQAIQCRCWPEPLIEDLLGE